MIKKNKNKLCNDCGKKPVFIKKRGLCKSCYYRNYSKYRKDSSKWTPQFKWTPQENLLKTITEKYGQNMIDDLLYEKNFAAIGRKYGLSRERIRQMHNILYVEPSN